MADPELEAIRQKRLTDLSNRTSDPTLSSSSLSPDLISNLKTRNPRSAVEDERKRLEQEELSGRSPSHPAIISPFQTQPRSVLLPHRIRRTALSQILDSDARERLSRIALVRPQRAREIEEMLMRMAQTGQLRGRVTEEQLINVLDQIEKVENIGGGSNQSTNPNTNKITYIRKDTFDDDLDF